MTAPSATGFSLRLRLLENVGWNAHLMSEPFDNALIPGVHALNRHDFSAEEAVRRAFNDIGLPELFDHLRSGGSKAEGWPERAGQADELCSRLDLFLDLKLTESGAPDEGSTLAYRIVNAADGKTFDGAREREVVGLYDRHHIQRALTEAIADVQGVVRDMLNEDVPRPGI